MKKSAIDLKSLLGQLVQKENKRSLIFDCPVDSDHSLKFYIDKTTQRTRCFECSRSWSLDAAVGLLLGIPTEQASDLIYGRSTAEQVDQLKLNFTDDDSISDSDFEVSAELIEKPLDFTFVPVEQSEEGKAYLVKRGITSQEVWKRFNIHYHASMNGVTFPVVFKGKTVGSQTRLITPKGKLRMVSSQNLPKARVLLNYDNAVKLNNIILAEGPIDCIKADQPSHGFAAVASFGKGVSQEQIQLLLASPAQNIYIGLDRDAIVEVEWLSEKLCPFKNVFRLLPPAHRKDLGDCTEQEILQALSIAPQCFREKTARLELFFKE